MFKLVLVRHGESTWNRENRFTGWTDVPLSEQGVREAHEISTGRALLAYCLPAVVCCGFLALAFIIAFPHISEWFEYWGN